MPGFRVPKQLPVAPDPVPVRGDWPCGVPDCWEEQTIVSQDDRYTLVECQVHECRTLWDTKPIERVAQEVIRVQDKWRQHGTAPPPGRR